MNNRVRYAKMTPEKDKTALQTLMQDEPKKKKKTYKQ
jgi:hypothetical protein